jgi:predicted GNAT superfamily acetyltransferase
MHDEITIRSAESIAEYRACQLAQRLSWGLNDDSYVVPIATMVGAQLHGGLVLGAFLPDGRAVGLSFAFLGRIEGRTCLYSQLTGLVPEYQDRGLGTRMKLAQRDHALRLGIDLIAWAFDPLQAGNARFNLDKLGATARRYVVDMYGPRSDALNRDTPTDRLLAEWSISPAPRRPLEIEAFPHLIETRRGPDGRLAAARVAEVGEAPGLRLEIPESIVALRRSDPDLAAGWQAAVRSAFLAAFARGFRAVGFVREPAEGETRCEYILAPQAES